MLKNATSLSNQTLDEMCNLITGMQWKRTNRKEFINGTAKGFAMHFTWWTGKMKTDARQNLERGKNWSICILISIYRIFSLTLLFFLSARQTFTSIFHPFFHKQIQRCRHRRRCQRVISIQFIDCNGKALNDDAQWASVVHFFHRIPKLNNLPTDRDHLLLPLRCQFLGFEQIKTLACFVLHTNRRAHRTNQKEMVIQQPYALRKRENMEKFNKIWNLIQKPCSILITIIIIVKSNPDICVLNAVRFWLCTPSASSHSDIGSWRDRTAGILMHNKFKRIDGISVCSCCSLCFYRYFGGKILVTKSNQNKIVLLMVSIDGDGGGGVLLFFLSVCCAVIAGSRSHFEITWRYFSLWKCSIRTLLPE